VATDPDYVIDTNALVDLWRRSYPRDVFSTLWGSLEQMVDSGFVIAPWEVYRELDKVDDELLDWAKGHKPMFIQFDEDLQSTLTSVLSDFQELVNLDAMGPDADPYIVALARDNACTVITQENKAGPGGKAKIPNVCDHYSVNCLNLIEFFREQSWSF